MAVRLNISLRITDGVVVESEITRALEFPTEKEVKKATEIEDDVNKHIAVYNK